MWFTLKNPLSHYPSFRETDIFKLSGKSDIMPEQKTKKVKWNATTFYGIIIIYLAIIILSGIYFFVLQGFGSHGLVFSIDGKDHVFNIFDIVLLAATVVSFFLVFISLLAFKRRKDNRIFILSIAFFLFALLQVFHLFDAFFPGEYIFTENAHKVLDLLILLSFAMLVYGRYTRK
jgi:magnesium-transporting ATPase (P-type)